MIFASFVNCVVHQMLNTYIIIYAACTECTRIIVKKKCHVAEMSELFFTQMLFTSLLKCFYNLLFVLYLCIQTLSVASMLLHLLTSNIGNPFQVFVHCGIAHYRYVPY